MARQLRVQFPGAIYHVVTRGDGRQQIFHDGGHYDRFTRGLKEEVTRRGWKVLSYCWMPNHIHLLVQTPEPNLARGMQHWLSGYANWYSKRNQRVGHLFQEITGATPPSLTVGQFLVTCGRRVVLVGCGGL